MISASLVLYNTDLDQLKVVYRCLDRSSIDKIFIMDNSPTPLAGDALGYMSSKVEYIYGQGNVGYGMALPISGVGGKEIAIEDFAKLVAKYVVAELVDRLTK